MPLLTVAQVAAELGEHPETVRTRLRRREIPAVRLGNSPRGHLRVDSRDLARFIARRRLR